MLFVFLSIFCSHSLKIFYPINNTPVGGGSKNNIVFHSHSQTNFTFPFTLTYNITEDPQSAIIDDLAKKCGLEGTSSNLSIDYKITVSASIAASETWRFSMFLAYLVGYSHLSCYHIPCDIESVQFPLSDLRCRYQRTCISLSCVHLRL